MPELALACVDSRRRPSTAERRTAALAMESIVCVCDVGFDWKEGSSQIVEYGKSPADTSKMAGPKVADPLQTEKANPFRNSITKVKLVARRDYHTVVVVSGLGCGLMPSFCGANSTGLQDWDRTAAAASLRAQ